MKRVTQCVCVLLIAAFFFTVPAFAAEAGEPRASDYFMSNSQYLYKTSKTSFDICYDVSALGKMDELGASKVILQKSSDGSTWTDIETYKKADYPGMIDHDTIYHAYSFPYEAEAGYYYRMYIRYYAKKGTGIAEFNTYSLDLKL